MSARSARRVAIVTGAGSGIGRAIAIQLAEDRFASVVLDLDAPAAQSVADEISARGLEGIAFGGVDVVISNAGIASSAPITETTLQMWDRNHDILARGYFIVAREAARTLIDQGSGGSIVFIGSKNALAPGKGAAAYSAAKAAELHLARCLAEELGAHGIRVNTVNPDAVLEGSRIWDSTWREERARAYGIDPAELEDFYRERTTLKVNVLPADIVSAILFFCSTRRAGKSTGNILNVDGGVALAYPR